jgi:hypothetical protein
MSAVHVVERIFGYIFYFYSIIRQDFPIYE